VNRILPERESFVGLDELVQLISAIKQAHFYAYTTYKEVSEMKTMTKDPYIAAIITQLKQDLQCKSKQEKEFVDNVTVEI